MLKLIETEELLTTQVTDIPERNGDWFFHGPTLGPWVKFKTQTSWSSLGNIFLYMSLFLLHWGCYMGNHSEKVKKTLHLNPIILQHLLPCQHLVASLNHQRSRENLQQSQGALRLPGLGHLSAASIDRPINVSGGPLRGAGTWITVPKELRIPQSSEDRAMTEGQPLTSV